MHLLLLCKMIMSSALYKAKLRLMYNHNSVCLWLPATYWFEFIRKQPSIILLDWINHKYIYIPHQRTCSLIWERERETDRDRDRDIDMTEKYPSVASHMYPNQALNLQPRHVPWPEIEITVIWSGTILQPTEPPGQGKLIIFLKC